MSWFDPTKEQLEDMLIEVDAKIKAWENSWGRCKMIPSDVIEEYNELLAEKYKLEGFIRKLDKVKSQLIKSDRYRRTT